jgi:hypothetical protein
MIKKKHKEKTEKLSEGQKIEMATPNDSNFMSFLITQCKDND